MDHGPYVGNSVPNKLQFPPKPDALRCEQCGWFDGQAGKVVTQLDCGHTICQSCCCPGPRGGAGGHVCRCGDDYYGDDE
jgi:hypothetical protein